MDSLRLAPTHEADIRFHQWNLYSGVAAWIDASSSKLCTAELQHREIRVYSANVVQPHHRVQLGGLRRRGRFRLSSRVPAFIGTAFVGWFVRPTGRPATIELPRTRKYRHGLCGEVWAIAFAILVAESKDEYLRVETRRVLIRFVCQYCR